MNEQDFNQELERVAHTVALNPLSETSVIVAPIAKGIVEIDAFLKFEQS